jgi:hypothetical protein
MRNSSFQPRRRALSALAALAACGALATAPGLAQADVGFTLSALAPDTWLQADGTFHVPLQLLANDLISIDHLEIQVVGVPGTLTVPLTDELVNSVGGLVVDLPGVLAGTQTIRVIAYVVQQPLYGVGTTLSPVVAETTVALAKPTTPGGGIQLPVTQPVTRLLTQPTGTGGTGTGGNGTGGNGTGGNAITRAGARPKVLLLSMRTIKGKRYAFVKSSAAVRLDLRANLRVGKKWRTAKRVQTRLVAKKVRRVPMGLAKPGRYMLRAVVRNSAGLTGTRTVKVLVKVARPR